MATRYAIDNVSQNLDQLTLSTYLGDAGDHRCLTEEHHRAFLSPLAAKSILNRLEIGSARGVPYHKILPDTEDIKDFFIAAD